MIDRRPTVASSETALPWSDPAVQWGLGVFETIAVRDGDPRFLDEHLTRLDSSATHLSIPLPDRKDLEKTVKEVRDGGVVGSGANGHRRALKDYLELKNRG